MAPAAGGITRPKTAPDDKQAPPVKMAESMAKKESHPHRPTSTASIKVTTSSSHVTGGQIKKTAMHRDEARKPVPKVPASQPQTKNTAPVAVEPGRVKAPEVSPVTKTKTVVISEKRFEATKRRFHEAYQEAADAKRRRVIQVIESPKMPPPEQRQRRPPVVRVRSSVTGTRRP